VKGTKEKGNKDKICVKKETEVSCTNTGEFGKSAQWWGVGEGEKIRARKNREKQRHKERGLVHQGVLSVKGIRWGGINNTSGSKGRKRSFWGRGQQRSCEKVGALKRGGPKGKHLRVAGHTWGINGEKSLMTCGLGRKKNKKKNTPLKTLIVKRLGCKWKRSKGKKKKLD